MAGLLKDRPERIKTMALERKEGVLKLTPETKKRLEGEGQRAKDIRYSMKVLKDLGMDTTEIDSKMDWAEKVRTTLLKEFG